MWRTKDREYADGKVACAAISKSVTDRTLQDISNF
jgi:hypothetical protein